MTSNVRTRFAVLKWIPRILMLTAILFSVFLGWYLSKRQEDVKNGGPTEELPRKGPVVVQKQSNIEYSHFDQGRLVYHVTAEKVETLKTEQQKLQNPEFIFYDENQKEMVRVTGRQCNISRDFNQITVIDDTQVVSKTGMQVSSHIIKYDSRARTFSAPGLANFKWRSLRGHSKGFVYNIPLDELDLTDSPEVLYFKQEEDGRVPIVMVGKTGMIDRKNGFAYFEGDVEVTQQKDKINAHRIEATFKPGGNDLQKLTAIKDVKVQFARPGDEGDDDDDDETAPPTAPAPKRVAAAAQTSPAQAPGISNVFVADSSSAKDLEADYAELFFEEDGRTIKMFHSQGDCTFVLHTFDKNNRPQENRIIKGQTFEAQFNSKGDMEQFHAIQDVSVRLQPAGNPKKQDPSTQQTIYCDDLVATFVPETGDVKDINFNENFKHVQGSRTVSSKKAVYTAADGKTNLIGDPEIDDASFDITSTNMELYEANSSIHAFGDVKSSFVRSEGKNTPSTFPFSSPSGQPVYISSEDMQWDSQKSEAVYTEKAKLWQEKNVITAAKIVINDKEKTLSAYDKVHTIFYNTGKADSQATQTQTKSGPTQTKSAQTKTAATQTKSGSQTQSQPQTGLFAGDTMGSGPMSVDAGIMNYSEKDRIIHFEKDCRITTETTKINSEKADFYLKESSSDFDRLYAQGRVNITHEAKHGTGDHATFYADERKLVLEGNPKLQEEGSADILGKVLTLFLSDDRILIDGQEDGRATTTLNMNAGVTPSSHTGKKEKKRGSKPESSTPKPEPD